MTRAVIVALGGALLASAAQAQAICSAPHSSPVLAQGGTIGTLAPGAGWVQVSGFRQVSDEFYNHEGEPQPFLAGGRTRTQSVFLTAAVGVFRGVDAWLQVPVHDLRYVDRTGERHRLGLGDVRGALRLSPAVVGWTGVPIAVRAGIKVPGTTFPVDATIIPLSEGQRDWELSVESGGAILAGGTALYALGWVGYRWREANAAGGIDPGDELFTHGAIGGRWGSLHVELGAEALFGRAPRRLGFELPSDRRRLFQLQPTVGYRLGPGVVELTLLQPVAGRSLPSGTAGSVGYRVAWGAP